MTEQLASYRRILKSSSIIGGSSVINILIGLLRTKVLAILIGPSGVGLVSLYISLMSTATTISCMGVDNSGTRQIAEAYGSENERQMMVAKRAMIFGTLLLACLSGTIVWSLRELIAARVLGNIDQAPVVAWLALGIALSVAGASQSALIQGMRRIGDMAKISIYSSLLNTLFGIGILWRWGNEALWAFILITPVVNYLFGQLYASRLPKLKADKIKLKEITRQWQLLLRLGIPFMGAALASNLAQLWIRLTVSDELGLDAVGHFQAAWAISIQYIGFVLGAMVADYYPRLTSIIKDKKAACQLVNEQTEITLLLSAPVFIAMIGLTPWVVHLLYSSAFIPTIEVLRWQILGDILKVASWPLGFIMVSAGAGKTFFWTETSVFLLMGVLVAFFIDTMGLAITGIAFLVSYVYYLPLVYLIAWKRIQFKWSATNIKLLFSTLFICISILLLSRYSTLAGEITASTMSGLFGIYTLIRLSKMSNLSKSVNRLGNLGRRLIQKNGLTKMNYPQNTHNVLVSIVVLTYNSASTVLETLESTKEQSYKNVELIITDDASKDDTVAICQTWLNENTHRFVNTQLITTPINTGTPANCNRGCKTANGEWLKIIAGDDILLTNCIEDNLQFVNHNPDAKIISSKLQYIDNHGNRLPESIISYQNVRNHYFLSNAKDQLKIYARIPLFLNTPAFFIKKQALIKINFFDEEFKIYEDTSLIYQIHEQGWRVHYFNKETVQYRVSVSSISRKTGNTIDNIRMNETKTIYIKYRYKHLSKINLIDLSVYYEIWLFYYFKGFFGFKGHRLLKKLSLNYWYLKFLYNQNLK